MLVRTSLKASHLHNIKLGQLKYLLEIYHGTSEIDLTSDITVDSTRTKGFFRRTIPFFSSSRLIAKIETLVKKLEFEGVKDKDPLLGENEDILIGLVKEGEQGNPSDATTLLCKRIGTIIRVDMQHGILYDKKNIITPGIFCITAAMLRIGLEIFPELTIILSIVAIILLIRQFIAGGIKATRNTCAILKSIDENHHIQKKCKEYSLQLQIEPAPKLILDEKILNAYALPFTTQAAKSGVIILGKPFLDHLDKEEIYAILSHELGHIKDLLPLYKKYYRYGLILSTPVLTALCFKLFNELSDCYLGDSYTVINWLCMLAVTIGLTRKPFQAMENYADNVATELVGPLSQSSSMRKLHFLSHNPNDFVFKNWPNLTKILKSLGMDDLFDTHPIGIKRMKI